MNKIFLNITLIIMLSANCCFGISNIVLLDSFIKQLGDIGYLKIEFSNDTFEILSKQKESCPLNYRMPIKIILSYEVNYRPSKKAIDCIMSIWERILFKGNYNFAVCTNFIDKFMPVHIKTVEIPNDEWFYGKPSTCMWDVAIEGTIPTDTTTMPTVQIYNNLKGYWAPSY